MSRWSKTRRDPGRTYDDDAAVELRRTAKARIEQLVAAGSEAEPDFVELMKILKPDISQQELKERIRQFRAAVFERQRLERRVR
jgi:hypothetical protein